MFPYTQGFFSLKFLSPVAYSVYYLEVIQHPASATFCEGTDATLNCTIFDNSTTGLADNTVWFDAETDATFSGSVVNNSRHGDVVTSVLSFREVRLNINNTKYLCEPTITVISFVAVIMVKGENSTHTCTLTYASIHTHTL